MDSIYESLVYFFSEKDDTFIKTEEFEEIKRIIKQEAIYSQNDLSSTTMDFPLKKVVPTVKKTVLLRTVNSNQDIVNKLFGRQRTVNVEISKSSNNGVVEVSFTLPNKSHYRY